MRGRHVEAVRGCIDGGDGGRGCGETASQAGQ